MELVKIQIPGLNPGSLDPNLCRNGLEMFIMKNFHLDYFGIGQALLCFSGMCSPSSGSWLAPITMHMVLVTCDLVYCGPASLTFFFFFFLQSGRGVGISWLLSLKWKLLPKPNVAQSLSQNLSFWLQLSGPLVDNWARLGQPVPIHLELDGATTQKHSGTICNI